MTLLFSPFYGLPPIYTYTQENSENVISIEYNDDVVLKLTISKYIISLDSLDKILKEELIKNIFVRNIKVYLHLMPKYKIILKQV